MPPIPPRRMTPAQQRAAEEMVAGRRGGLYGPFVPALRSPELMTRLQRLGDYLRYDSALPQPLRELAILLTARRWTQQYEWFVHAPLAAESGLKRTVVEAIAQGRRPARMTRGEAVVYDFVTELHDTQAVGDKTYRRSVTTFGEPGVVDLVATIGYYTTLAMIMNVARTALPPGHAPELAPLP